MKKSKKSNQKLWVGGIAVKKAILKISIAVLFVLAAPILINFIPTLNLKTAQMSVLEGKWVNVYYEKEKVAALDVFEYADSKTENIAKKLGFSEKQNVNIYIYDNQKTMQRKKYGFIGPMLASDWYIGDNIGTNVILTSPANHGKVHDYNTVKEAVLHEIVHAYISIKNPKINLWLTEGMALYLTNGRAFSKSYLDEMTIPSYEDINTRSPIHFEKCGGYTFANTYIEFLDKTYGWDKVLELIWTENYDNVLNKSSQEIYNEWVNYLKNYKF